MGNNQSEREYEEIRLKQTISLAEEQLKQAKEGIEQLSEEPPEAKELIEDIERLLKTISGGLEANFGKDNSNSDLLQQLASDPETLAQRKKLLGK